METYSRRIFQILTCMAVGKLFHIVWWKIVLDGFFDLHARFEFLSGYMDLTSPPWVSTRQTEQMVYIIIHCIILNSSHYRLYGWFCCDWWVVIIMLIRESLYWNCHVALLLLLSIRLGVTFLSADLYCFIGWMFWRFFPSFLIGISQWCYWVQIFLYYTYLFLHVTYKFSVSGP